MSDLTPGDTVSVTTSRDRVWFGTVASNVHPHPQHGWPAVTVLIDGKGRLVPARWVEPWPRVRAVSA